MEEQSTAPVEALQPRRNISKPAIMVVVLLAAAVGIYFVIKTFAASTHPAPTPISPANGSSTEDTTPTFNWTAVTGGSTSSNISVNDNTLGTGFHQFEFSSGWTYPTPGCTPATPCKYQDDDHYTATSGNFYQVRFNGTAVKVYATKDAHHGIATVTVDGTCSKSADLYAATRAYQQVIYDSSTDCSLALPAGATHIVKVVNSGSKNAASTGTVITADRVDVTNAQVSGGSFKYKLQVVDVQVNPDFTAGGAFVLNGAPIAGTSFTPTTALATQKFYKWRVRVKNSNTDFGDWSSASTFAVTQPTQPPPGGDVVMVAGDYNENSGVSNLIKGQNPVAILGVGDFCYSSQPCDPAAHFNSQFSTVKSIFYPTAGPTHDVNGTNTSGYSNYWGKDPYKMYSFNIGSWHFISLPSAAFRYGINTAQISSDLEADLTANTKPCTAAFWHEPYWTLPTSTHGGRDESGEIDWITKLYNHNAEVIFNGHQHNYQRFAPANASSQADTARGIREFVVGTGGVGNYPFTSSTPVSPSPAVEAKNDNTLGALKFTLKPSGYTWEYKASSGSFTDTGSGTCH